MRILSFLVLSCFLFTACGFKNSVQTTRNFYKNLTPPEYYSQTKRVSFSPNADGTTPIKGSPAEVENTIPETKSERVNVALIGILAGIVVVAGTVVPLVILNN